MGQFWRSILFEHNSGHKGKAWNKSKHVLTMSSLQFYSHYYPDYTKANFTV